METDVLSEETKSEDAPLALLYGGAKTFAELDQWTEAQVGTQQVMELTSQYQGILSNIMSDDSLPLDQKAKRASVLAEELQGRVRKPYIKESMLSKAIDAIKSAFHSPQEDKIDIDFQEPSGFKIIKTPDGYRWLAFSSNAFKDLDGELFTTKALEEAVDYADQTGDRGPLRVFHVPGTDIGDADFQGIAGRFLIESGTFRSDELGSKAVEYFLTSSDKQFQVSIGFQYKVGDEEDGVYDWLRIRERSVTPFGDAANPFTNFAFGEIGGELMDERKVNMLTDMFGKDLASKIVGDAESKSKDLEDKGVSFKSTGDLLEDLKATIVEMPEGDHRNQLVGLVDKYSQTNTETSASGVTVTITTPEEKTEDKKDFTEVLEPVVAAIESLANRLEALNVIQASMATLEAEVNTLKEKDAASPRARSAYRATEADDNVLDPDKIKDLLGADDEAPTNPARAYVEDLIQLGTVR